MKRAILNPAMYVIHHGARYLFPLVVTPYLAAKFGPSYFADFVIWNACVWTASLFMEYGFFLYAVKETAVTVSKLQLEQTCSKVVSSKLSLLPIALIVYAILTVVTGLVFRQPVAVATGAIAVISYGGSFAWYFQGQERAITAVVAEAAPQIAQFLLIFLLVRSANDVWIAATLQSAAALSTVLIALSLIFHDRLKIRLSSEGVAAAVKGATPFFIERLCLTLYQTATPLFIAGFSIKEQAAYYSVGDKFLQFLGGLSIPVTYALLPGISRRIASDKTDWGFSLKVVVIISVLTCTLALGSFFSADRIILYLFQREYAAAIPVAQCFCVAACLVSYNACVANFILVPGGRAQLLIVTSATALVLSLTFQAIFLPRFGALGSAASRLIAELAVAIILSVVAKRVTAGRRRGAIATS